MRATGPFRPEDERFRLQVRRFVERQLRPRAAQWEKNSSFPRRAVALCAERGFLRGDAYRTAVVAEEMPGCESPGFALTVFVQSTLVLPLLDRLGTSEQKRQFLDPLARGRRLGALAVSEPAAGSDVAALTCRASKRRDSFVLDGVKTFVTNGAIADFLIVAANAAPGGVAPADPPTGSLAGAPRSPRRSPGSLAHTRSLSSQIDLVLVPTDTPGVRVERLPTLGLGTSAMARITFRRARVPNAFRLGEEGAGLEYVQDALNRERLFGGLASVAWAELTMRKTAEFARARRVFGKPLTKFQAIRHQFAEMATALEAARQLNYATLTKWAGGADVTKEICMIKLFSYDAAQRTVERCLQIHGGVGYLDGHWISRVYRDARALTIAAGTPEVMKDLIAAYLRL